MTKPTFYVTTPIYYPSGKLHIGHAYTTVAADAIARFKRYTGYDVKFLTGTDEHGEKIQKTAVSMGKSEMEFLDEQIAAIKELWGKLEISYDDFIRTTEPRHTKIIQKIFTQLYEQGDIYKGEYEGYYCTPCESFWTKTQLLDGHLCPDCGRETYIVKEESYFFRLSKYEDRLKELFKDDSFCYPEARRNDMVSNFLEQGLEDLSVTRTSFDWGIKVPFDEKHVIYVWIDALCNYITALGYMSEDDSDFKKYWPANYHLVGKEIIRFHTIIWPALLMALGLELPKRVFGNGWILFADDKMSKSKGNIVYPEPMIERYGVDTLKYFLLREFSFGNDGSYTHRNFINRINSDLANDLGNLISRTAAMINQYKGGIVTKNDIKTEFDKELIEQSQKSYKLYEEKMDDLMFHEALDSIWQLVRRTNKYIDETTPWILGKDPSRSDELDNILYNLAESIRIIASLISPLMPDTSRKIFSQFSIEDEKIKTWEAAGKFGLLPSGTKVVKAEPLFPRIDAEKEIKELETLFAEKINTKPANKKDDEKEDGKEKNKEKTAKKDGSSDNSSDHKPEITIDDFDRIELRTGKILEAEKHPKADKLLVFKIKVGDETRQIVSGIAAHFEPKDLIGKEVVVVCNLKPVKLRGIESQGMLLTAGDDDDKLVLPDVSGAKNGSIVC